MSSPTDKLEVLFEVALALETDAQRADYLDRACPDPSLREEVEALLAAHRNPDSIFAGESVREEAHPTESVGTVIGRYKLLEALGEGGFGAVWLAEQKEPVRRRVALKVIKLGMDTKQVVARFEAERQALALMDHPSIATVLDAGTTESGRPYFVMELVRGIPITKFCDENKMTTEGRLDLFIKVCNAVQHAHQKGIIHRDLKPSNVLVTLHDGVPVPKVIDFGIAKATQQELTDKTIHTLFQQFIGTPAYVSPEQAEMSGLDIDTRSDIYSLGVLLYELFTGTTPFGSQALLASGLDTMRRTIREQEPVRPSTRVDTMPEAERTTAAGRLATEPGKLVHLLRGDLDWIVMKCLEKDRMRRYETANGLAMDLKRYQNQEPVVAGPPNTAYRLQKFVRRNKVTVIAGSAVATALVLGVVVSTWQAARASRLQMRAEANEQKAVQARTEENRQRRRAEQNEAEMRRQAYAADINLAHQAVRMNNLGRASELLDRYRPKAGQEDLRGWEWRYLWGQCQSDALFTLCRFPESDGFVSTAMRPGASWVAIGGRQRSGVEVWDLSTRRRLAQLATGELFAHVAFSPDGGHLAYSTIGWLRVWDCATQLKVAEIPLEGVIVSVAFSADGQEILTFQPNKAVTRWRASKLERLNSRPVPEGHASLGTPFAVTPDLRTAVVVNGWNGIVVLDLESGQERWRTDSPSLWAHAMAISPDGARLATCFGPMDGTIQIWDLSIGAQLSRLEGHRAWVSALRFRPDGKTLVSASADQTIRIWDVDRRECIRTLQGHRHEIWSLGTSSDATTLVSGSKDGEVLVWDTTREPDRRSPWTLPGSHWGWSFSGDGRAIHAVEETAQHFSQSLHSSGREPTKGRAIDAFAREPGRLRCYLGPRFDRDEILQDVQFNGDFVFSPSGRRFAATMTNGILRVWNLDERIRTHEFHTDARDSRPVAFSTDETRVWLLQEDGEEAGRSMLTEWDLPTQQRLRSIPGVRDRYLTIHPYDWLFWRNDDDTSVFYNLGTGQPSHPEIAPGQLARLNGFPSVSADGTLLVLSHDNGVLTVWETASLASAAGPRQVKTLGGFMLSFSDSFFTPDGTRLLGGSHGTEALKIWETRAWHELLTLDSDGTYFSNIGLSADGSLLGALKVVQATDGTGSGKIQLWHAPTWEEIEARENADQRAPAE